MYAGNSGCYGIILFNTEIDGANAVYGYYEEDRICIETGTLEEMRALKTAQEKDLPRKSNTGRLLVKLFLVYLAAVVAGLVILPLKIAFALLVFCALSYFPVVVIMKANSGLYSDPELEEQFCRFHGCEHAAMRAMVEGKSAEMESFEKPRIYDPECGTVYGGYAVTLALELALLIIFWPGLLKAAGVLLLTFIVLVTMILKPRINPFTILQHPVVLPPTEKEYMLVIEIMKKLRELE